MSTPNIHSVRVHYSGHTKRVLYCRTSTNGRIHVVPIVDIFNQEEVLDKIAAFEKIFVIDVPEVIARDMRKKRSYKR